MAVTEDSTTAGQAPQAPEPRHASTRDRVLGALGRSWLFFFLIGLLGFFWLTTPPGTFLTWSNLEQIALSTSEVILLAIGETFVIVTAGIDLSIGGILFFSAVCGGEVMLHLSGTSAQTINGEYPHAAYAVPIGIVVCIAAGTLWGFINGMLITRLRLPPFIVTLGTLAITLGLGDLIDGGSYLPAPVPPDLSERFGSGKIFGFYAPIYVAAVFLLIAHLFFRYARFGRYTAAVGSNEEGTRRTGINVNRHIVKVYALAGFCAGVAAVLDLAIYHEHDVRLAPDRQPQCDRCRRDRRYEPVRRRRHDHRQRDRRLHPDRSPERPRDQGRLSLLAGGRRRSDHHPRRLPRPAAPAARQQLRGGAARPTWFRNRTP